MVSFRKQAAYCKGLLYPEYWVWIWSVNFKKDLLFQRRLGMASPERSRKLVGTPDVQL